MPISSRAEYRAYLAADLKAHGLTRLPWTVALRLGRPSLVWQRRLRYVEYVINCRKGKLWRPWVQLQRWRLLRLSVRMGFDIPPNVFGPGLCLVHFGTIIVSTLARVGANCRMHPSTCIGEGKGKAPHLGDGVYIGPGAKLYGGITIGDCTRIGANAVVNKSFGANLTLAGVPAKAVGTWQGPGT